MRTTVSDFELALKEVDMLLEKYEPKHKGAWKDQDFMTHVDHAFCHLVEIRRDDKDKGEELVSATCRCLMALTQTLKLRAENEKRR